MQHACFAAHRLIIYICQIDYKEREKAMTTAQTLTQKHTSALVTWQIIAPAGDIHANLAIQALGAERALHMVAAHAPLTEWEQTLDHELPEHFAGNLHSWQRNLSHARPKKVIEDSEQQDIHLITPEHQLWPKQLGELGILAPHSLWAQGNLELLTTLERSATVTGARAATSYGLEAASEITEHLAANNVTIVAGTAFGIDSHALKTAVIDTDQRGIAIAAGGLDRPYPAAMRDLQHKTAQAGLVLSETPAGYPPSRWRFLQRNRIAAAISTATIVIEAGRRCGAINTATHASQLGRALGAVPGAITSTTSSGCHRIIRELNAQLIASPEDALELI